MNLELDYRQFNGMFEIVSIEDVPAADLKVKEFKGTKKLSRNGKPVYSVRNCVVKNLATGAADKNASLAIENPCDLKEFSKYGASGGIASIVTYVGSNYREALSITLESLTENAPKASLEEITALLDKAATPSLPKRSDQ